MLREKETNGGAGYIGGLGREKGREKLKDGGKVWEKKCVAS